MNNKRAKYWRLSPLEYVEEEKLEVVCDVDKPKNVLVQLRKVHPYEEPAIDIVPLLVILLEKRIFL